MHFALSSHPHRLTLLTRAVTLALASAAISSGFAQTAPATPVAEEAAPRAKDDAIRLGTITITGSGAKLGAGQILNEDAVKARSTVTKDATEKDRATGNPYQAISILPGVNTFSHDATGLFGGGLTVRGFNSDQIGFTINGVPVNDSGNYAVFPQEYVDQENICTQSLSQGNPDVESPHVGATGGSVNITNCDPEEKRRFRVSQTLGGLKLTRSFVRADTGRFANDMAKVFLSYSHTEANKWKGPGSAKRDHVDAAFSLDLSPEHRILGSVMYNKAINTNYLTLTQAQLASNGYFWDLSPNFTPGHLPAVAGTRQVEAGPSPAFYKLAANPFENVVASLSGSFKLVENTYLKVQPYLWTGYGTGGTQQQALSETGFLNQTTGKIGAARDLNGDGDTLDSVIVARSNVTKTFRPGVTTEISYALGNHQLKVGFWYERAEHKQTAPAVAVDANGNAADIWLRTGHILRPDGSEYQGRNSLTVSPASQIYASDSFSFMEDRGLLQVGVRAPRITRNYTNTANEAANSATTFTFSKTFSDVLPQAGLRYKLDRESQVFLNVGKNFRAPPNFALFPSGNNLVVVNGVPTLRGNVLPETAITTDLGYRYQGKALTFSGTVYNVDYKNRQANAYNADTGNSTYNNAGDVRNRGLELELGSRPVDGFSAYASFTAQRSKIKSDISPAKNVSLPTSGKQFALTPEMMAGLSLQYASGPFYARLKVKHTSKQYSTLMNDEEVPGYTTGDFDAGYKFGDFMFVKNSQVRFNVSNIGDKKYLNASSGSSILVNAKPVGATPAAGSVGYYLGAPRFFSVTLSADF